MSDANIARIRELLLPYTTSYSQPQQPKRYPYGRRLVNDEHRKHHRLYPYIRESRQPPLLQSSARSLKSFKHGPLNHLKPSMRLVTVLPDLSSESYIQCSMHHTTTSNAEYTCSSYAWGEAESKRLVLMNGRLFYVQMNLFSFLEIVRTDPRLPAQHYWIDALCIDQNNTAERNHQVAQMGMIYSNAELVIAWLGHASIETLLPQTYPSAALLNLRTQGIIYRNNTVSNEYWSRAWITQELVLARQVRVMLGSMTFALDHIWPPTPPEPSPGADSALFLHLSTHRSHIIGKPLALLLCQFSDRACTVPRDRIFSLVSLCSEEVQIQVDYECPVFQLAHQIVAACSSIFCLCTTLLFLNMLGPEIDRLPSGELALAMSEGPYLEFTIPNSAAYPVSLFEYGDESRIVLHRETCELLDDLTSSTDPRNTNKKTSDGFSWSQEERGAWKFRVSFVYIWSWRGKHHNFQDELCEWSQPAVTSAGHGRAPVRLGWGDWDIHGKRTKR